LLIFVQPKINNDGNIQYLQMDTSSAGANSENMKEKLKYRMYGMTPYNLSPIQQGIQFGHAVVEYSNMFSKEKDYKTWAERDKTFIILNGGTTNNGPAQQATDAQKLTCWAMLAGKGSVGSMQEHAVRLKDAGVKFSMFFEPDLNFALTGLAFLVDERVWDRESHPSFQVPSYVENTKARDYDTTRWDSMSEFDRDIARKDSPREYKEWLDSVGGKTNEFLRDYLRGLRLA